MESTAKHPVYRCVWCGRADLVETAGAVECTACQRRYPVLGGVPLLAKDFTVEPSGYQLTNDLADKICGQLGIVSDDAARLRLKEILGRQYRIGGFAQTAENNYFLNRVIVNEADKRRPTRSQYADRVVNENIVYTIDLHYVPPRLQAGEVVSYNVRFTNRGESVISSVGKSPVFLCYLWRGIANRSEPTESLRMKLPIDLLPGRSLTVPLQIRVPTEPGQYNLELCLIHENVSWLHVGGVETPVSVVAKALPKPWDNWLKTGIFHGGYDADHRAGGAMLAAAVGTNPPAGTRILEIGGCCSPMTTGLPAEITSLDIDMQTLQVGRMASDRRGQRLTYVCADANELPFQSGSFDWVVMFSTLHHFADPSQVLKDLTRVLKPTGQIATLCEPLGHYYQGEIEQTFLDELEQGINEQTFTLEEYHTIFRWAGLVPTDVVIDVGSVKAILRPAPKRAY